VLITAVLALAGLLVTLAEQALYRVQVSAFQLQEVLGALCTILAQRGAVLVQAILVARLVALVVAVIGSPALAAVLLKLVRGTRLRAVLDICGPLIQRITAAVVVAVVGMGGLLLVALVAVVMADNVLAHRMIPPALTDLAAALAVTPITAAAVPVVLAWLL
jgi:hypothetical protein